MRHGHHVRRRSASGSITDSLPQTATVLEAREWWRTVTIATILSLDPFQARLIWERSVNRIRLI
jgi:hypothetical protein